jgi:hypothetical protein
MVSDGGTQLIVRRTDDRGRLRYPGVSMTAVVVLMLFLALLTVADLLPALAEPHRPS